MVTKYLYSILVIIKLLAVRKSDAYGSGAPASACSNLTPGHGVQLTGNNPFTISVKEQVSGSLLVTISSSDNTDFEGFILQAREVGSNTPLADFRNPPDHTHLTKCTRDMDTATHSDTTAKKSVTFTWVPNPGESAKLRFHATVAINKESYWKGIVSEEINLSLAGTTTQLPSTSETTTPYSIPTTRQTATEAPSMIVPLPSTDSQATNTSTNQPPPTTVDTTRMVNGSVPQTTVTMPTTPSGSSKASQSTATFMLLVINLIYIMSVLLL